MSINNGTSIWHARLGYIIFFKLKIMMQKSLVSGLSNIITFSGNEVCERC